PTGRDDARQAGIPKGLQTVGDRMRARAPGATLILMAGFARNDNMAVMPTINKINANIGRVADGRQGRYLNINDKLGAKAGRLLPGMMNPDGLRPAINAYQVWADALKPLFMELLGPRAKEDFAPPPTGDPSAVGK